MTFEFRADGGNIDVEGTSFSGKGRSNGATFNETGNDNSVESLVFRNASKLNNVTANLGGGDDGIELGRNELEATPTTSTGGKYNMGTGKDSVIFGANTKLKGKNIVDLGNDNDADVVSIEDTKGKLPNVKGLQIDNFGSEDILKIGGVDFNRAQLEVLDGNIAGIKVNFRQNPPV